jgi:hypothetical protein
MPGRSGECAQGHSWLVPILRMSRSWRTGNPRSEEKHVPHRACQEDDDSRLRISADWCRRLCRC